MKRIKMLKKLIAELEDRKDIPTDAYMNGRNLGIDVAINLLSNKLRILEESED